MIIGKTDTKTIELLPRLANRHGLVAGATGTGKTVTLRLLAEGFSAIGVPCLIPDIKQELSGMSTTNPVEFWDLYGELGHPIRTTCQDLSDLLLARLLDLNRVQTGIMTLLFKVCEDQNVSLLDLTDIKVGLQHLADNAFEFKRDYGNINYSTVGVIQREILSLRKQGVNKLFNTPTFIIDDFFRVDKENKGFINILKANTLINTPKLYTTFLLWLLSEIYEKLPEVGDLEKPKFVFFFDEAHLLFKDCPKILLEKIEMIVRLVRSKGVGVYFITQSALDIPESVLGQLGNRVQHALRAFTPKDRRTVKAVAETFRENPYFKTATAITELKIGEALVSFLQVDGDPSMVEKVKVTKPKSQLAPISEQEIKDMVYESPLYGVYENPDIKEEETPLPNSGFDRQTEELGRTLMRKVGNQASNYIIRGLFNTFLRGTRGGLGK